MVRVKKQFVEEDVPLASSEEAVSEPLMFAVASNLHKVTHLPRNQHLAIWKRVVELYYQAGKGLPEFMLMLDNETFVADLLHDEVFWAMAGSNVTREYYAFAPAYLSAVYATAALMAAREDALPISAAELALLQ